MSLLTKDYIFGTALKQKDVLIKEWGGSIRLRSLKAKEFDEMLAEDADESIGDLLIMACCVDGDGNQMFTKEDLDKLKEKDFRGVNELRTAVVSWIFPDAREVEKKSEPNRG